MDHSAASSLLLSSPVVERPSSSSSSGISSFVDSAFLHKQTGVPSQFVWPKQDVVHAQQELQVPLVDLAGFLRGDEEATKRAAALVRAGCLNNGFFQVINHGVHPDVIKNAYEHLERIFKIPIEQKMKAWLRPGSGSMWGYSGAHAGRFNSRLPWKETLTFGYQFTDDQSICNASVVDYFKSSLGMDFEQTGMVYQKYCEAMKDLSFSILELMAISLGVADRMHYRDFFGDGYGMMRCNFYPPCQDPAVALGTGPHCDPTALTILYQDQVAGLDVFTNNIWQTVRPRQGALVINIGDTFAALSNGLYKSCLHRATVNKHKERRSFAFFVCPRLDKVVRPPSDLVSINDGKRRYPDFKWSELLQFTQKHYRADGATLENFTKWFLSSESTQLNQ